ncbi:unnamed protein product [Aphanomyces euteiches]
MVEVEPSSVIHGLSFPTDLLFNLEAVRKHCSASLATHQACLTMLKGRIQLEQYYASELARLADQFKIDCEASSVDSPHATTVASTLDEALSGLKSQYMNTSVQHKALATNLDEEVYRPMEMLYKYLVKKESKLQVCTSRVRKQSKAFEDHYRKHQIKFDKQFRDASTTYAQAMEAGIAPEIIQCQYTSSPVHWETKPVVKTSFQLDSPRAKDTSMGEAKARSNSFSARSSGGLDSSKLVSWLLPNEQQKKDNTLLAAVKSIENAEVARQECRQAWLAFEEARIALFRSIQSILNDYQVSPGAATPLIVLLKYVAEYRISNLTTSLRKHVIFASSSLANTQYDWQMLAPVMEAIDAESDIRAFILTHQRLVLPQMTVNDLCRSDSLPLPPISKSIQIADITSRKFPHDKVGNINTVFGWLATRSREMHYTSDSVMPVVASTAAAKALLAALELKVEQNEDKHPEVDIDEPGKTQSNDDEEEVRPATTMQDAC